MKKIFVLTALIGIMLITQKTFGQFVLQTDISNNPAIKNPWYLCYVIAYGERVHARDTRDMVLERPTGYAYPWKQPADKSFMVLGCTPTKESNVLYRIATGEWIRIYKFHDSEPNDDVVVTMDSKNFYISRYRNNSKVESVSVERS